MIENCLASTGMSQNTILLVAVVISLLGVGLFLLSRRYKLRGSFLAIVLMFVAVTFVTALPVSAQSANSCSANADSSGQQPGSGIQLTDDAYDLPAGVIDEGNFGMTIAANDLFPDSDPINWATLDLDPSTPEVDTYSMLYHPDYPSYACGYVWYNFPLFGDNEAPETVYVNMSGYCHDADVDDHRPEPSHYTFQYTAASLSGKKAPQPATVTLTLFEQPIAFDHTIEATLGPDITGSVNVADNAIGTIDPSSVDLDPSTPGQQTSITVPAAYDSDIDVTIEVDSNGLVTLTVSIIGLPACSEGAITADIPYTIKNSLGTTSNIAVITTYYPYYACG